MRKQITETAINKAAREAKASKRRLELADPSLPGLRLRVTPAGAKTWILGCRDRFGAARRFTLGQYPTLGLSEAREAARSMRQDVRGGADPIAERRRSLAQGKAAKLGEGTLRALLDAYGATAGATLRSWPHSRLRVERVFAPLLDRPLASLSIVDLLLQADGYRAEASAAFAVRTLRPVLKWAQPRGHVSLDLSALQRKSPVKARARVLSATELARVLPALRASARPHAAALLFMLLTLARREEVCGARWRDVDLDAATWSIPPEATKNGEPHVVPLSLQAVTLLRGRRRLDATPDDLVFATPRQVGSRKRGPVSIAWCQLGNWDRETKAIQTASKTDGWHRHDLRRTGATMLGDMGELPDIVEAALNHTAIRSAIASTYNRSRYRPAVASALQRLADRLDEMERAMPAPLD